MPRPVRYATEVGAWWAAALGIWLLTLSSVTTTDLQIAVPVALLCGVAAVGARRAIGGDWRVPAGVAHWALRLPLAVVVDLIAVLVLPWRRLAGHGGEGRLIRVPVAPGPDPRPTMRRATAAILVSMTPGSIVFHDDDDTGELVVHTLAFGRVAMTDVVRR